MRGTGKRTAATAAALALSLTTAMAHGAAVFDAGVDLSTGNCAFNTACAKSTGLINDYAGQRFTLNDNTSVNSASYVVFNQGKNLPVTAHWMILSVDGAGGLPGAVLASGSSTVLPIQTYIGSNFGYNADRQYFNFDGVTLASGSYYFALQVESASFYNYLAKGGLSSGAAEYQNGSWAPNYGDHIPSVAVALYGNVVAVPEPAAYALLLGGFAILGVAARRRRQ